MKVLFEDDILEAHNLISEKSNTVIIEHEKSPCRHGRSQFGHWYMQAVPGTHPQLLPVRHCLLRVALSVTVFVVVNKSFLLLVYTLTAVTVLGDVIFGAETSRVCVGCSHGATGGLIVQYVYISRNTGACSIFCILPCALDATNGSGFFMSHTQLL